MTRTGITDTLTPEERAHVIEWALSCFADRYVERLARAAPDLDAATHAVRARVGWGGRWGRDYRIEAQRDGIHVMAHASGHAGRVSYREVAETARRGEMGPVQLAMELTA